MPASKPTTGPPRGAIVELDEATIRFAGDAADGMQLVGAQFAATSSRAGNVVCTLPDLPAEIRAITGTLANVSAFQVHFSSRPHHTPGGPLDALVAMNPAALNANLVDLSVNGILIVNADAFTPDNLEKAGFAFNPLQDDGLKSYTLHAIPMNQLNHEAVARVNLNAREAERCRNFFALGVVCWLYERSLDSTLQWVRATYAKNPAIIEASTRTLKAGYQHGETIGVVQRRVRKADIPPGPYRTITGNEALTAGLLAVPTQAKRPLVFACFPLTPANEVLHQMCDEKQPNVTVIQAEDDLAALQIAIGASFGGAIGVTATTGPGLSLQSDALGLAVISELPCVIIDIQRAGPSLGMPAKTEQADLLLALGGRHGECPLIVLAPATPSDCFSMALEAVRLAVRYMSPVVVLVDTYLARCAESWRIPSLAELPAIDMPAGSASALPYERDDRLSRPWIVPGTPDREHRTGGLEKEDRTGNVTFDPLNHAAMVKTRAKKIANVANEIPPLVVLGDEQADLLVVGWGSTFGAIESAVERCRRRGLSVALAHLRYLNPLPKNTGEVLKRHRKILVPELNAGQLCQVLRATYLVDPVSMSKVQGRAFLVGEIERKIEELIRREGGAPAEPRPR